MATIPSGYPSSATTGVPAGTQLSVYTGPMTITKDGTVIDGKIVNGSLIINADNVVIKNSQINYSGYWGIDGSGGANLIIQDSDIVGPGYSSASNAGILIGHNGQALRNDVSKSENGIVVDIGSATIKGNYVHDLEAAGADPHYDGIAVQGNQNSVLIEGNTVISRDTSAVFIKNDFGPINNVVVKGNYLTGDAGYQVYVDGRANGGAITNVQISGNYIEKGYYGYFNIENSSPVLTGNVQLGEGQLPPALSGGSTPPPTTSAPAPAPAPSAPAPTAPNVPKAPVAEPSSPIKAPVNVPSSPVPVDADSGGGSSGGGVNIPKVPSVPANAIKAGMPAGNGGSAGNVSVSQGDIQKISAHGVNVSTSGGVNSNVSLSDIGNVLKGVGGHSAFQFNGLSNVSSNLERVSDQYSAHSSITQISKAGLLSAYAASLLDSGDGGAAVGGHGNDGAVSPLKNVAHSAFDILS